MLGSSRGLRSPSNPTGWYSGSGPASAGVGRTSRRPPVRRTAARPASVRRGARREWCPRPARSPGRPGPASVSAGSAARGAPRRGAGEGGWPCEPLCSAVVAQTSGFPADRPGAVPPLARMAPNATRMLLRAVAMFEPVSWAGVGGCRFHWLTSEFVTPHGDFRVGSASFSCPVDCQGSPEATSGRPLDGCGLQSLWFCKPRPTEDPCPASPTAPSRPAPRSSGGTEALPVADRAGGAVAGLHRVRRVGATGWGAWFWIGPVVILVIVPAIDLIAGLDRSNPPDDVIEALEQDRYYRWITYLFLPIQYVGFVGAFYLIAQRRPARHRRRPEHVREDRPGHLDRLHRRHRHQHRPRARPQARGERALAVQDRAGAELLRPLLHRAQPRPPRPGRDARGPGELAVRRELLPVLAAHGRRLAEERVAPGEEALRAPQAAPVPDRQRRAQRLADVGGAVGRAWSPGSASGSRRTS